MWQIPKTLWILLALSQTIISRYDRQMTNPTIKNIAQNIHFHKIPTQVLYFARNNSSGMIARNDRMFFVILRV